MNHSIECLSLQPPEGLGSKGLGFKGLGFKGLGFRAWGLGFRVLRNYT